MKSDQSVVARGGEVRRFASLLEASIVGHLQEAAEQLQEGGSRGVHLSRKAMRRARAALQLATGSLRRCAKDIDAQIRSLCASLSPLRDVQAGIDALTRLERRSRMQRTATRVAAGPVLLQRRRQMLQAAMSGDPDFAAARERLAAIRGAIAGLGWQHVSRRSVRHGLEKSLKRCRRAVAEATQSHAGLVHHRARRRLRTLKYQIAALDTLALRAANLGDSKTPHLVRAMRKSMGLDKSVERRIKAAVASLGRERDAHLLRLALPGVVGAGGGSAALRTALADYRRDLDHRSRRALAGIEL